MHCFSVGLQGVRAGGSSLAAVMLCLAGSGWSHPCWGLATSSRAAGIPQALQVSMADLEGGPGP